MNCWTNSNQTEELYRHVDNAPNLDTNPPDPSIHAMYTLLCTIVPPLLTILGSTNRAWMWYLCLRVDQMRGMLQSLPVCDCFQQDTYILHQEYLASRVPAYDPDVETNVPLPPLESQRSILNIFGNSVVAYREDMQFLLSTAGELLHSCTQIPWPHYLF